MFQSLSISGFKAFGTETEVPFAQLTVLAGANSVGKSSIVQSLLLSRLATGDGSGRPADRVPLNGQYLLALGRSRQVAAAKIVFGFQIADELAKIELISPPDDNYLAVKSVPETLPSSLSAAGFHYLNAERIGPRTFYSDEFQQKRTVGFQGEFAMQLLVKGLATDTAPKKNFHRAFSLTSQAPDNLQEQTVKWMGYILPGVDVSAYRLRDVPQIAGLFNGHLATNVGFGVSYTLPIVVAGLIAEKGTLLIVENPEAHLHPSGQSRIGQFLAAIAASGVQILVETHSEHIVNGMRLAAMNGIIPHNDVVVNFLSREDEYSKINVHSIRINQQGDLSDFPRGFFDQAEQDLLQIIQIRRKRP